MKTTTMKWPVVMAMLVMTATSFSGEFFQNRGGIVFKGSYWSVDASDPAIRVRNNGVFNSEVKVSGAGGSITFLSGIKERGAISFSLGGVAHVHVIKDGLFNEQVDIKSASPILIGYQVPLFKDRNMIAFQPYVTGGAGPYLLSHIVGIQENCCMEDDVTVSHKLRPGLFAGAGAYFMLTDWFALHSDMRYHLVNFTTDNDFSGFELGVGLAFFWKR